jgi:hypothetical protein
MLILWEVTTGDNINIFAREEDAQLLHDVVEQMIMTNGHIPSGYPLKVRPRKAYGIASAVIMSDLGLILVDWMSGIDFETIPEGFEQNARWPAGFPGAGQLIFSVQQIQAIQVTRAAKKLYASVNDSERTLLSGAGTSISDLLVTGSV